jgi:signal transduction histidine kinase
MSGPAGRGWPPRGSAGPGARADTGPPEHRISVRARLTLLYGAMFYGAGVALLLVTYLLVRSIMSNVMVFDQFGQQLPQNYRAQVINSVMHRLLLQSVIALVVIGVAAIVVGYVVAGRALAPLQRVTATARRLSESTLHQRIALEGPEDEIKELADTFDAMLERLARAFDSQRRFVANASHELRTPLTINRTLLEVALADPQSSEDLKVVGRTLLATNARHQRLIDGLLLLARSERGLEARTSLDLSDVAHSALVTIRPTLAAAGLSLDEELAPAPTVGEPVLLEHLVHNLLDNAVKYNCDGGTVWLRTWSHDGSSFVYVANTGPAVAPYDIPRLFEPFRRLAEDRVGSERGAGLGLSIVASVVRAHAGGISAVPRPGGGLEITVRMNSGSAELAVPAEPIGSAAPIPRGNAAAAGRAPGDVAPGDVASRDVASRDVAPRDVAPGTAIRGSRAAGG